jgi:hypothetical protein
MVMRPKKLEMRRTMRTKMKNQKRKLLCPDTAESNP